MPTYRYRCASGHLYEKREPFGAPAQQPCERCDKPSQRVLTSPTLVFKGAGWYKTDSRGSRKSKTGSDRDSEAGERESAAKSDTGSETSSKTESETTSKAKSSSSSSTSKNGSSTSKSSSD